MADDGETASPRRSARVRHRNLQQSQVAAEEESRNDGAIPSTSAAARGSDRRMRNLSVSQSDAPVNGNAESGIRRGGRPRSRRNNLLLRRKQRAEQRAAVVARGRLRSATGNRRRSGEASFSRSESPGDEPDKYSESGEDPWSDYDSGSEEGEMGVRYARERPAGLAGLHSNERRGRDLQFLNAGHKILKYKGLTVSIMRTAEHHSREFNAAESQFMIRFREADDTAERLSWDDTYHVLSESLTVALRWLAEDYSSRNNEMWARIQLHENGGREMPSGIDQAYYMSGTFRLNSFSGLVRQTLAWCERISQSQHTIRLNQGLLVYISILSTSQVEKMERRAEELARKRKAATRDKIYGFKNWTNRRGGGGGKRRGRRRRQLAGGGGSTKVPTSIFGYFTSQNYFKIPREIDALQSYCLPASLIISHLLSQKRRAEYLQKRKRPVPRECTRDAKLYKTILRGLSKSGERYSTPAGNSECERRSRTAVKLLLRQVRRFLRVGHFPAVGPYSVEDMLSYASERLSANILVFSSQGNFLKYVFPEREVIIESGLLHKRRQFMLYEEHASPYSEDDVAHIGVITKNTFFKDTGYHCFKCNMRIVTAHSRKRHVCRQVTWLDKCGACQCILLDGENGQAAYDIYYVDASNCSEYCLEEGQEREGESPASGSNSIRTCPDCNIACRSKECFRLHTMRCQKFTRCPKCDAYVKVKQKNKQEALDSHVCFEKLCKVCWEIYDTSVDEKHKCKLTANRHFSYWPRYAFWDIECSFSNTGAGGCEKCTLLETQYMLREKISFTRAELRKHIKDEVVLKSLRCDLHKVAGESEGESAEANSNIHTPLVIVLYYETHSREKFSRICFGSPEMELSMDCEIEEGVLTERYIPVEMRDQKDVLMRTKFSSRAEKSARLGKLGGEEAIQKRRELQAQRDSAAARSIFASSAGEKAGRAGFTTLADLKCSGLSAISKFLLFTARPYFKSYCFLACNSKSYDSQFLLECMLKFSIQPRVITNGRKLQSLSIPSLDITYSCSRNFLMEGIEGLSKRFDLEIGKYGFPINCMGNIGKYMHYKGDIPEDEMYITFRDTDKAKEEKIAHLAELRAEGKQFDFDSELVYYCQFDTIILLKSCMAFTRQSFDFQRILMRMFPRVVPEGKVEFVPPFGLYISLPSYAYDMYKRYGVPENATVYALESETGCRIRSSYGELEVALFYESVYPGSIVYSQYTTAKPMKLGRYTPDVFIVHPDGSSLCVEYHGCAIKSHQKEGGCPLMSEMIFDGDTPNFLGRSGNEFERERRKRDLALRQIHGVSHIKHIWECEWNRMRHDDFDSLSEEDGDDIELAVKVRAFFDTQQARRPKERLVPREAMRGGRTENFMLNVNMADHPNYTCEYLDICSLYPAVALHEVLPCGDLKILISHDDISRLAFSSVEGTFGLYYADPERSDEKRRVHGLIQCCILPPRGGTTNFPLLPITIRDRSLYVLCYACALVSSQKPCEHSDSERALVSTWTVAEIACAVEQNNYTVMSIYEVYCYFEALPLFRDFVSILASFKMRCEGYPEEVRGDPLAEAAYVAELNEAMSFSAEGVALTREMIALNAAFRAFIKIYLNSFLGKSAQRIDRIQQQFIMSQAGLDKFLFKDQSEILSWTLVSSDILHMRSKKKGEYLPPNRVANVVVGSHITAFGRIWMQQAIQKLLRVNASICYMDTDSLIFLMPKEVPIPLRMSSSIFGAFKRELGEGVEILSFQSLGPKNYVIRFRRGEELHVTIHVRGLSLQSRHVQEYVNAETLAEFALRVLRGTGQLVSVSAPQFALVTINASGQVETRVYTKRLAPPPSQKRVVIIGSENSLEQTFPYGYV